MQKIVANEFLLAVCVVCLFVATTVIVSFENNKLIPANPAASAHYLQEPHNPLSYLANWDGPIYLAIAAHGYTDQIQANFFPLYPLLVRGMSQILRSEVVAGLAVSWLSLVGAVYFYLKIVKQLYKTTDNQEALRALLFFLLFPTSIFLAVTYTEGLFAFLALGALYYSLQKRWLPAALFAMFSTATHANGVFVAALVALILLGAQERAKKIVAALLISYAGLVAYMIYLQLRFHNALAFVAAQKNHSWLHFSPSYLASILLTRNAIFVLLLGLSVYYWWRRRKSFAAYSFLYVCIIFLSSKGLSGDGRYTLMAFPVELMLYDYFRNKKVGYIVAIVLTTILWTYFMLQYAAGYSGG